MADQQQPGEQQPGPAPPPGSLPGSPPESAPAQTPQSPRRLDTATGAFRTAAGALVAWGRAVVLDGLCVAVLWIVGLELLHVPLAPIWAVIAGLMAFLPNFGPVIALLGPVFSILLSGHDMDRLLFLLGWYAIIVVIDQLILQPVLMKRITRVPIWASLLAPIALGILIPFWGVLLAPPLLAVIYAFRRPGKARQR